MELKNMTVEQIEARKAEIAAELEKPEADLDALQEEARSLNAELEARKAAGLTQKELADKLLNTGTMSNPTLTKEELLELLG